MATARRLKRHRWRSRVVLAKEHIWRQALFASLALSQPSEGSGRSSDGQRVQTAIEDQGFNHKQPDREDHPQTDHRVHPPVCEGTEPIPEAGLLDHVKPRPANQQDRDPRLPDEAALDGLEGRQPVAAQLTSADCRQERRGHDRKTSDPNDHGEHMQGAGERKAIHLKPTPAWEIRLASQARHGHGPDQGRLPAQSLTGMRIGWVVATTMPVRLSCFRAE
jgi:hypothetical protein